MQKVFYNIYKADNFEEKINKKCCKSVAAYLVKCLVCQEIICFQHTETVNKEGQNQLVCFLCFYKV